ncbi:hypothetical protein GCM10022255_112000 [Dactylosporangium darangshiense]|uniref:Uncharacterized protein n=1 Tax=Dactylosporangium darangshiense TaxID=579108 RepID=A0ABP8DV43_9ACTN
MQRRSGDGPVHSSNPWTGKNETPPAARAPALGPGNGLRRPGHPALDPTLRDAKTRRGLTPHTKGSQTTPARARPSRFAVAYGEPGAGRRGPAGRSLRDGMPLQPRRALQ